MVGIGIDAVDVARFRAVLARTPGVALRLFTDAERVAVARRHDAAPGLAARFAAKEAVMKALGVGLGAFSFHDVEVRNHASGQPFVVLQAKAASLAHAQGVTQWALSMTHTATTAQAVAVAQ